MSGGHPIGVHAGLDDLQGYFSSDRFGLFGPVDDMRKHGAPKHIISDQAPVFAGGAFAKLLDQWNTKPRFGAVGKSGSIAVTERVIKTLKYEWFRRVPPHQGL